MKAITNIYNSFIHTNILTAIFFLTILSIIASFITVMFVMFMIDLIIGSQSINYYTIGIILSLIIPLITTPVISYKIILLVNKLKEEDKKLSSNAQFDNLTKIYNKRHTLELASYEFALSKRVKVPISAILIEYTDLKDLNNSHGYEIGDSMLVELARSISTTIRNTDIFGRYSGSRFLLIYPNLGLFTVERLAQKIRLAAEQVIHVNDDDIQISLNIGCAEIDDYSKATLQTLIDKAERSLLQSKNNS